MNDMKDEFIDYDVKRQEMASDATLRDYFAAKSISALISGYSRNSGCGPYLDASPDELAEWAYKYADAMIKERAK